MQSMFTKTMKQLANKYKKQKGKDEKCWIQQNGTKCNPYNSWSWYSLSVDCHFRECRACSQNQWNNQQINTKNKEGKDEKCWIQQIDDWLGIQKSHYMKRGIHNEMASLLAKCLPKLNEWSPFRLCPVCSGRNPSLFGLQRRNKKLKI